MSENLHEIYTMKEKDVTFWAPSPYEDFQQKFHKGEFTLEQLAKTTSDGKNARLGEIVCVGATIIIIVLLLCIWILYEIKESDV